MLWLSFACASELDLNQEVRKILYALTIKNLCKTFGTSVAVKDFSIDINDGEFLTFLGPSGCGKTTILRMIAGLVTPDRGQIVLQGLDVTHVPVHKRKIGLVFQSYALFPHMTVFDNIAFGLRRNKLPKKDIAKRVSSALEKVRLDGLDQRFPKQLSGGQQQRVALGRAIAPEPSILLLDEPLSNLDKQLRMEMQVELKRLQQEVGVTTVFVTHDQSEAMAMSDRICVLKNGEVQQVDSPEQLYHQPQNKFIATFLGRSNVFEVSVKKITGDRFTMLEADGGFTFLADMTGKECEGNKVHVVIRHEVIKISKNKPKAKKGLNSFTANVTFRAFSGSSIEFMATLSDGPEIMLKADNDENSQSIFPGDSVWVSWDPKAAVINKLDG